MTPYRSHTDSEIMRTAWWGLLGSLPWIFGAWDQPPEDYEWHKGVIAERMTRRRAQHFRRPEARITPYIVQRVAAMHRRLVVQRDGTHPFLEANSRVLQFSVAHSYRPQSRSCAMRATCRNSARP